VIDNSLYKEVYYSSHDLISPLNSLVVIDVMSCEGNRLVNRDEEEEQDRNGGRIDELTHAQTAVNDESSIYGCVNVYRASFALSIAL
jgi:hypothetical protein